MKSPRTATASVRSWVSPEYCDVPSANNNLKGLWARIEKISMMQNVTVFVLQHFTFCILGMN